MTPEELSKLDVAVIGAGYAGAMVAKAFHSLGANVTAYEQARQLKEVGAGIGLRPSSVDQFKRWGSLAAIEAVTSPSFGFEILTPTGDRILMEEWPEKDAYGQPTRFVHRGDFLDALVSVLPDGMVRTRHKLVDIVDHGDSATATFANGESVTADLIIGADGIHSTVREKLFSPKPPRFAGEHAYRAVIDAGDAHGIPLDDNLRMYVGHGTKIYVLPLQHRSQVSFDVTVLDPDSAWEPEVTKADLLGHLDGFDERLVAIARDLDMDQVIVRSVYDIDPIENWHSDSVVLIGDAAHAMCHHQGQGANSAIMDAGVLAEILRDASSVPAALAAYQENRKPKTDELQRVSRQGWDEADIETVFPGQRPGELGATTEA